MIILHDKNNNTSYELADDYALKVKLCRIFGFHKGFTSTLIDVICDGVKNGTYYGDCEKLLGVSVEIR